MEPPNFSSRLASNRQDFYDRTQSIIDTAMGKPRINIRPLKEILAESEKIMGEKAKYDFEAEQKKIQDEQKKIQDLERQRREFKTLWDSTAEARSKQFARLDAERAKKLAEINTPGFRFKDSPLVEELKKNPEIMARVKQNQLFDRWNL